MSTHDYDIANAAGSAVRADLNLLFAAIVSQNSSLTEPTTMFSYQYWADTTTGILKQRNSANTAWISLWTIATGAWLGNSATSTTATNQSGGTVNATTIAASGLISANGGVTAPTGQVIRGNTATGTDLSAAVVGVSSGSGHAVYGSSDSGIGVSGSSSNIGVYGFSTAGYGVFGSSTTGYGVVASAGGTKAPLRITPSALPTGPNALGDMYMTTTGVLKICTVAGTPGTWISVGAQT
jgi:hypothetical protein